VKEKILYQDEEALGVAGDKIICLTFLTVHPGSIKRLIYTPALTHRLILKLFPNTKFYSLSYIEDEERVPFYDMRISLVPLRELKELCMKLETNDDGERIVDIDVHIFFRRSKELYKVSRKVM